MTVSITRNVNTGEKSPSGQDVTEPQVVIASLPCCMQPDEDRLVMPMAGQTSIDYRLMFCDNADIRPKDIVTVLTAPNNAAMVGATYLVSQNDGYSFGIEHMEIRIEGGVL